jgi:hypothetical protein
MDIPEWLGKARGYMAAALFLSVLNAVLLWFDKLDAGNYQLIALGVWGAVAAGGAAAAYRK